MPKRSVIFDKQQSIIQQNLLIQQKNIFQRVIASQCPLCNIKCTDTYCTKCLKMKKYHDDQTIINIAQHIINNINNRPISIANFNTTVFQPNKTQSYDKFYKKALKTTDPQFIISNELYNNYIEMPCSYCSAVISNGVDSLIPTDGYIEENTVFCCKTCSNLKDKQTYDDFYNHLKNIIRNCVLLDITTNQNNVDANFDQPLLKIPTIKKRPIIKANKPQHTKQTCSNGRKIELLTHDEVAYFQQVTPPPKPKFEYNKIINGEYEPNDFSDNNYSIEDFLGIDTNELNKLKNQLFKPTFH